MTLAVTLAATLAVLDPGPPGPLQFPPRLRSWILSFGALARVVSPSRLARDILSEMDAARQRYITVPFARLKTTIPEDNKAFSAQVVRLRAR